VGTAEAGAAVAERVVPAVADSVVAVGRAAKGWAAAG